MDNNDCASKYKDHQYYNLPLWDRAHRLTTSLHLLVEKFPPHEIQGFGKELCQVTRNLTVHIAESTKATQDSAIFQHLKYARRALLETECLLLILAHLPYLHRDLIDTLAKETQTIAKMLNEYRESIESNN